MWNRLLFVIMCVFAVGTASAYGTDDVFHWLENAERFGSSYPQEKVYLHIDNTSYYQGDDIWFKAYVVNPFGNTPSSVSGTLYVELLNPGGEVIDKRILKIKEGQCHGDFTLNRVPFYSGFYEIRAYTKYMLNFGEDVMYSRVIPVFDRPKNEGDFTEKTIQKYGRGKYTYLRKKPQKEDAVNVRFYPEGGHLVMGNSSKVGFEATDAYGHPIDASGYIMDSRDSVLTHFSTLHEGKGAFMLTPPNADQLTACVDYEGKKCKIKLPEVLTRGYTMSVDNITSEDTAFVSVQHCGMEPNDTLGLAVLSHGVLYSSYMVILRSGLSANVAIDKTAMPSGVVRLVLFDKSGSVISDRLIYHEGNCRAYVATEHDKTYYAPYEPINMTFRIKDVDGNPVVSTFSLSVRERNGEVEWERNILTDLLLMSDIKGYVANPDYYFESDDEEHRTNLDLLLLVQGWRRHSWDRIIGKDDFSLRYEPEDTAIDVNGRVLSLGKKVPKPGVEVSAFLLHRNEDTYNSESYADIYCTDSLGRFYFNADVKGEWNMVLSLRENGKKKNYLIQLDRLFSPSPRQYRFTDMELNFNDESVAPDVNDDFGGGDATDFIVAFNDSLSKTSRGMKELPEVVVKGKKRSKERDIYKARSKSIAYYDVKSGIDDIRDEGEYIGDDIHKFLRSMNRNFSRTLSNGEEYLLYKGRMPLFVINYTRTMRTKFDYDKYKNIRLEAIKSIYISEDLRSMCEYADPMITPFDIDKLYGCVVFIETYPDGEIPADAGKGVRKTRLEGYSTSREFYHPDYSMLEPDSADYRRTLYWNPDLSTDETGEAKVQFYNNGTGGTFDVDLQTVTPTGLVGITR